MVATGQKANAQSQPKVKNIILVHGAFADGSGWERVYNILTSKGYNVSIVQNPCSSLQQDVAATNAVLERQDGPAILVGHSWGGTVITQAGMSPKVVRLVYINAFVPEVGETSGQLASSEPPAKDAAVLAPDAEGWLWYPKDKFHMGFAGDISREKAEFMYASQVPIMATCFATPVTVAAWKTKPSYAVISTGDKALNPIIERKMYKRAGSVITEINASHVVYVSQSQKIADARKVLSDAQAAVKVDLSGIEVSDKTITSDGYKIKLNIVRPAGEQGVLPVFVFIHGGGWVLGDFPTHQRMVRDLVVLSGAVAVFVNYTPTPDAIYPQAVNEIYAATKWVAEHGSEINVDGKRLAVVGNSVGGNMTAVTTLLAKAKNGPEIKLQMYVLEGELTIYTKEGSVVLGPGETFTIPKGTQHVLAASGSKPTKALTVTSPSGFARLIREIGVRKPLENAMDPKTLEKFMQLSSALGDEILGPPGSRPYYLSIFYRPRYAANFIASLLQHALQRITIWSIFAKIMICTGHTYYISGLPAQGNRQALNYQRFIAGICPMPAGVIYCHMNMANPGGVYIHLNAQTNQTTSIFRIYEDNDFINIRGKGTDKAYSGGTRLDLFYEQKTKPQLFPGMLLSKNDSAVFTGSWGIMQMVFTPNNIKDPYFEPDDYFYSGALFIIHSLTSYSPARRYSFQAELQLGVRGPAALAKQTQTFVHRIIHYTIPMGWDNQLQNAPIINMNFGLEKQVTKSNKYFELLAGGKMSRQDAKIILLDLNMPDLNSTIQTIKLLQRANPEVKVLILTMYNQPEVKDELMKCGIFDFIHKGADIEVLIARIHTAHSELTMGGQYAAIGFESSSMRPGTRKAAQIGQGTVVTRLSPAPIHNGEINADREGLLTAGIPLVAYSSYEEYRQHGNTRGQRYHQQRFKTNAARLVDHCL
ncbi:hydrolase, alpha/beta domain protein [Ostertagia ostertagi]